MARFEDPDSGSGEFFINLADSKHLDPQPDGQGYSAGFAVFGRVVGGMSVAEAISRLPTQSQAGLKMLVDGVAFSASLSKSQD
jgi:peptidyl-prolyl cis-trans isomerase A (cyclophilin A)